MAYFGKRKIIKLMQQATQDMTPYHLLYRRFRKIRHDFANYVQSSSFEGDDEEFYDRLRTLKKNTLSQVDELLQTLSDEQVTEKPLPDRFPYLAQDLSISVNPGTPEAVLQKVWNRMRLYFLAQLRQIPDMIPVLTQLQDRLQRSLPPDEQEAQEHLDACDSLNAYIASDHVLISAYVAGVRSICTEADTTFYFQLGIPEVFKEKWEDYFYLLASFETVFTNHISQKAKQSEMIFYPALVDDEFDDEGWNNQTENKTKDQREAPQQDKQIFRLRMAENMGLWHMRAEAGPLPIEQDAMHLASKLTAVSRIPKVRKLLRGYKTSFNCGVAEGICRMDITG
ncbi:MAG: hypothetical protein K5739_06630 [Lachnospiraceae bacterium]|nr:hypothetical protein [Lachnospiraceae bacterium]